MSGPCLCGDPACPSCGPAQGFCPKCVAADKDECDCADEPDEYDLYRDFYGDDRDEA